MTENTVKVRRDFKKNGNDQREADTKLQECQESPQEKAITRLSKRHTPHARNFQGSCRRCEPL